MQLHPDHPQSDLLSNSVLTIGNFDGVHLGHQALLQQMQQPEFAGLPHIVVTFDPHPAEILYPERKTQRLFSLQDQQQELAKRGITHWVCIRFDKTMSQMQAQDFFENYLRKSFHPKAIVVGYDFSFGKSRAGTQQVLQDLCDKNKISLQVVPEFNLDGQIISTTLIKELLSQQKLAQAAQMLGRNYSFAGEVQQGLGIGEKLGAATANLMLQQKLAVPNGVYITRTDFSGQVYQSISNLGYSPTIVQKPVLRLETHLFDFQGELPGKRIKVEFLQYLRAEKKFADIEELKNQIHTDLDEAKRYFQKS